MDAIHPVASRRRSRAAFVAQLFLTGAVVAVSRIEARPPVVWAAVLGVASLQAVIVAAVAMGAARERWLVPMLLVAVVIFAAGLLAWPAWDVYERARTF